MYIDPDLEQTSLETNLSLSMYFFFPIMITIGVFKFTFPEKQQILFKWSCKNRQEKEITEPRYGLSKPHLEVDLTQYFHLASAVEIHRAR